MEPLLKNPEPVLEWLESRPDDWTANRLNCQHCPLAQYLTEQGIAGVHVSKINYYSLRDPIVSEPHEPWVKDFIRRVDHPALRRRPWIACGSITKKQAVRILRNVIAKWRARDQR